MASISEYINPKVILEDKREYKEMLARAEEMPADYQFVFDKIQHYMFGYATGTGKDVMVLLEHMLGEFNAGVAEGWPVLDVTGQDVAAYCDKKLKDKGIYTETRQEQLNREIKEKLG